MGVLDFSQPKVYQLAFALAMEIFEASKSFPTEEKYSLTDQVRRSSRSVCANLAEAYRKKRYSANFISKLTDCDAENSETGVWLMFANSCNYISSLELEGLLLKKNEIGKLIGHMITNPEKY
ncbi:MAG: four helix bundle protein [Ferruginibacter sp.]